MDNLGRLIDLHPALALATVFAGGVAVSFTPCMYPIVPVTLGVIGARSAGARWRGFLLSSVYVLGMALSYASLGAFAALSGKLFGQISTSPWTHFAVANLCLVFGLAMLDVFRLPQLGLDAGPAQRGPQGLFGVFLFGMAAGLIVGPCTAPVLGTLLVYVGSRQNLLYGFLLLLCFGYGVGFLLILLGTFTGLLSSLPRSGLWMERVKKVFGWGMVGVAEYLLIKTGELLI
ncbi:MAG: cytochrome c biogenesis protein CcdA [Gammaproteobacteria bacterium]